MCLLSHNLVCSNPLSNNFLDLFLQKKIHPIGTSTQNSMGRPTNAHKVY